MFGEGEDISFELEVIFLICDLTIVIFGIVTFFINKHRNLSVKEICLFFMSTFLIIFHFHEGFHGTAKPELNNSSLNVPSLLCGGKTNVLVTEY